MLRCGQEAVGFTAEWVCAALTGRLRERLRCDLLPEKVTMADSDPQAKVPRRSAGCAQHRGCRRGRRAFDASNPLSRGPQPPISDEERSGVSSTDMEPDVAVGVGESRGGRAEDQAPDDDVSSPHPQLVHHARPWPAPQRPRHSGTGGGRAGPGAALNYPLVTGSTHGPGLSGNTNSRYAHRVPPRAGQGSRGRLTDPAAGIAAVVEAARVARRVVMSGGRRGRVMRSPCELRVAS